MVTNLQDICVQKIHSSLFFIVLHHLFLPFRIQISRHQNAIRTIMNHKYGTLTVFFLSFLRINFQRPQCFNADPIGNFDHGARRQSRYHLFYRIDFGQFHKPLKVIRMQVGGNGQIHTRRTILQKIWLQHLFADRI